MGLDIFFRRKDKRYKDAVATELAYFRKVNFLVNFMEQYGFNAETDNCEDFPLTKEIVQDLYDRCKEVILAHLECSKDKEDFNQKEFEKKAHDLLPTCDGFFFGNTEYDNWYYEDVKDVKTEMKKVLAEFDKLNENEIIAFHIWY